MGVQKGGNSIGDEKESQFDLHITTTRLNEIALAYFGCGHTPTTKKSQSYT
jgi:hypothetical protein